MNKSLKPPKTDTIVVDKSLAFEEEKELIINFRAGDLEARDKIVKKYTSLVTNIARKYKMFFPNFEISELIAEGNYGLLQSIHHYDFDRKVKFSTYAWFWIVKYIQKYIADNLTLMKLPNHLLNKVKKILKHIEESTKKGEDVSLEGIFKKVGLDLEQGRNLIQEYENLSRPLLLDKYIDEADPQETINDIIADRNELPVEMILEKLENKDNFNQILNQLTEEELNIIKWRFGFFDSKHHTLKELSKKFNISPQKVKDIEEVALAKLKKIIAINEHD